MNPCGSTNYNKLANVSLQFKMSTNAQNSYNKVNPVSQNNNPILWPDQTGTLYEFISEGESGSQHPYIRILPDIDYRMTDGYGRRKLNFATGNPTFKMRISLNTTNRDVSPMIDINRLIILTINLA